MTLEELKEKKVTILINKEVTFFLGEDMPEDFLKEYLEEQVEENFTDSELLSYIKESSYSVYDILDWIDFDYDMNIKVSIGE